MATPDLIERVPTSSSQIPKMSSTIETTAALRADTISFEVKCLMRSCLQTADTGVSSEAPG